MAEFFAQIAYFLTLDKSKYYLFIKERKNKKNNRQFYKELLNQL